jgi:chemotaxis protein methyltransferase CheR
VALQVSGDPDIVDIESSLLLEGVYRRYGHDLRSYAASFVRRRVAKALRDERLPDVGELSRRVLRDPRCAERLVRAFSVKVTSMFRHPPFFKALREDVLPALRSQEFVRIWIAGCCSGEEAYSLAIVLRELGLESRCRIYATDVDDSALERAAAGTFPLSCIRDYSRAYLQSGGRRDFSSYYVASADVAVFDPSLRSRIVFARHNLATDASFNEFHVALCRNVLIYFDRTLRSRALGLLDASLAPGGVLGLGEKESLRGSAVENAYVELGPGAKLYRRRDGGVRDR